MRAVTAVFTPEDRTRQDRLRRVERLANEVLRHIQGGKNPKTVILLYGKKLEYALPGTPRCRDLMSLKSAMCVGTYDEFSTEELLRGDLEAVMTEYEDGRPTPPAAPPREY